MVALLSLALETFFEKEYILIVGFSIGLIIEMYVVYLSIKYNQNKAFTGFFVGITKIVLGFLFLFQILVVIDNASSRRRKNAILSFLLITIGAWFVKSLINGEKVYELNGWEYSH